MRSLYPNARLALDEFIVRYGFSCSEDIEYKTREVDRDGVTKFCASIHLSQSLYEYMGLRPYPFHGKIRDTVEQAHNQAAEHLLLVLGRQHGTSNSERLIERERERERGRP
jgi:hypothetical protein